MKNIAHFIVSLLLFYLASSPSLAQLNYYDGWMVTTKGDTLHGLIRNNGDSKNFRFCSFKSSKKSKAIRQSPNEISAYMFGDNHYYILNPIQSSDEGDQAFMEVLLSGQLSLYLTDTDAKLRYYFRKSDGGLIGLVNEEVYISDQKNDMYYVPGDTLIQQKADRHQGMEVQKGQSYYGDHDYYYNVYKDSLYNVFSDNEKIRKQLDSISYTSRSLISITSQYINLTCEGPGCISYQKDLSARAHPFGFYMGLGLARLFYTESDIQSGLEFYIPVGAFYNFPFSRLGENLSLQLEFLGRRLDYKQAFQNLPDDIVSIRITSLVFGIPILLNYRLPLKPFSPIIAAGYEFSFVAWSNTSTLMQVSYPNDTEYHLEELESKLNVGQPYGFFFDLGGDIPINNKLAFTTRLRYQSYQNTRKSEEYLYPNLDFGSTGGTSLKTHTLTLLLGLKF